MKNDWLGTRVKTEETDVAVGEVVGVGVGTDCLVGVGTWGPVSWRGGCTSGKARTRTLDWGRTGPEDGRLIGKGKAVRTGTRPSSLPTLGPSTVLRGCTLGGAGEVGSDPVYGSGRESRRKVAAADEREGDLEGKKHGLVDQSTSGRGTVVVQSARQPWSVKEEARSRQDEGRECLVTLGR